MGKTYFSSRNSGPRERTIDDVSDTLWNAVIACIETFITKDYFAEKFPTSCPDGSGFVSGTNKASMVSAIKGHFESVTEWPPIFRRVTAKTTLLDIVEFAYEHISKPDGGQPHSYHKHYHYFEFSKRAGQSEFQNQVNDLFSYNGLIYELQSSGEVTRIGPPLLRDDLEQADFRTTDPELNQLLATAKSKFSSRDAAHRIEALEKLWDAWERIKTVMNPSDKQKSIEELLERAIPERALRERVNLEAKELTHIGNNFMIRHTEVGKPPIRNPDHVDYLFHRLFSLVHLLLKSVPSLPLPPRHPPGGIPW